jgi:hypothetical protein
MVCIHGLSLQKQFSSSSGAWYRTNLHRQTLTNNESKHFPLLFVPREIFSFVRRQGSQTK